MNPSVFSITEACEIACTGRTALYQAINARELIAHKRGKRTLFLAADLQRWIEALPQMEVKHPKQNEAVSAASALGVKAVAAEKRSRARERRAGA